MTTITIITFEPDWCAVYVDGELYDDGHNYQEDDILKDIMVDDEYTIDEKDEKHVYPGKWKGTPKTLDELGEMYDTS